MKKLLSLLLILTMVTSVFAAFAGLSVSAAESATDYLGSVKTAEIVLGKTKIEVDTSSAAITSGQSMTIANFFDEVSANTKIEGNIDGTLEITWKTTAAATAAYYAIYTGNDNESWGGRNPSDGWTLSGSTDGAAYTVLDTVDKGREGLEDRNNTAYAYAIETPGSYQFYKLEIPRPAGYFQLNGIELFSDEDNTANLDTDENSLTYGRLQVPVTSFNAGVGCGFMDGNINVNDVSSAYGKTLGISRLLNATDNAYVCDNTEVYVNGVEARFNKTYLGYTHCGRNADDGFFFGIVGAGYTANEETEITLLIGDRFYATTTFTPDSNALAVASSSATYQSALKTLSATVTFVDDHGLNVGDELSFRLHDDHTDRTATVTAVDGKTVTLEAKNVDTTKSLLEFTVSDGVKFSIPVDTSVNTATLTATGYVQTRANATDSDNKYDTRIVVEANMDYLAQFTSATLELTFTTVDGETKVITSKTVQAYKKVTANGDEYLATENCALFGVAVINIPNEVNKVSAKVTFASGDTTDVIELGTAPLENPAHTPSIDTTGATNISEGMTFSYIHGFEYPSEFGGPLGLVYVFQDDTNELHKAMQTLLANGGYVLVSIDGKLYKSTEFANGAPWFRMNVESAGAVVYSGISYEIILYVYDANHTMQYYTNASTHVAANSSTNAPEREMFAITLPDNLNEETVNIDSVSSEGLNAWGDSPATNLFDGTPDKIGGSTSGSVTINFSLDAAATLRYYTLYTGGDTSSYPGRNPSKWTLYGKVGEDWVELSTVATNATQTSGLGATNNTPYSYAVTNPQECTDYKIVFATGNDFQLNEMEVFTVQ